MGRESLIQIQDSDLGSHPEALALNDSFRSDVPILKLSVEIDWEPEDSRGALSALEARLVKFCPSLREHQCRGEAQYHILRSINGEGRQVESPETPTEAALALAHLFEHVLIDTIAFITDAATVSGATGALKGSRNRFDLFLEAPDALAARFTVGLARSWVSDLVAGQSLNGEGRMTLELARYLYNTRPDAVEASGVARGLGRDRSAVREGLGWLERRGLARRIGYSMNFSGLSYYALPRV